MKTTALTFVLLLLVTAINAQSDQVKAKLEFFAEEECYRSYNFEQSIKHLNQVETLLESTNTKILHLKIKSYCKLKQYADAYEEQERYFNMETDQNDSKYIEIESLLAEINEFAPMDFKKKGLVSEMQGRYNLAIEYYEKAISINPNNMLFYNALGYALYIQKKYNEAIDNCTFVLQNTHSKPENKYTSYRQLTVIYFTTKKYIKSVESGEKAIEIYEKDKLDFDNSHGLVYIELAGSYASLKNKKKSLQNFELALNTLFGGKAIMNMIITDSRIDLIKETEEFTALINAYDYRNGKIYQTVMIGEQLWMAENLEYYTQKGCWQYNVDRSLTNEKAYLYNWHTAQEVCPDGWHLPSKAEFELLLSNFGGEGKNAYYELQTGGSSGFSSSLVGIRTDNGRISQSNYPYYWSSSSDSLFAYSLSVNKEQGAYIDILNGSEWGFPVRCIKD